MRSRPWILVLALMVALFALIMYHGWSLFNANERIKNYLISQLEPVFGDNCKIKRLDMALGAIHLKDVEVEFKNSRYKLAVKDLRIGYNLTNLIKSGFKPQKSPQDILLVNPQLTITFISKEKKTIANSKDQNYQEHWNTMRDLDFLKRITISKGSIVYEDSAHYQTSLANEISGWISTLNAGQAKARLTGNLFQSKKPNLKLYGKIDLIHANLDSLIVNIMNFQWTEKNPFFIPNYLDIQQGTVNGNLAINENVANKEYNIKGNIYITNGTIALQNQNLYITDINLETEVHDYDLIIKRSNQIFNGSIVSVQGEIKNIIDPELNLEVHSDLFDIHRFQAYFHPDSKLKFAGSSTLTMSIQRSYKNPFIQSTLNCSQLAINNTKFRDVKLRLAFQDSILSIISLTSKYDSLILKGRGEIDVSQPDRRIGLQLITQGNLPDSFKIGNVSTLANSDCRMDLQLEGSLSQLAGRANLYLLPKFEDSFGINFSSNLNFQEGKLSFTTFSAKNKKCADGIFELKKSTKNYELNFHNIHELVYQFPEYQSFKKLFNFDSSQVKIKAERKDFEISSHFTWKNGKQRETRSGNLSIKLKDNKISSLFLAKFGSQQYKANIDLIKNEDGIKLRELQIDDILSATGSVNLAGNQPIEGAIIFSNSDLNHLYNLVTLDSSFLDGKLTGKINISGTFSKPLVDCNLKLDDGYINQNGIYTGVLNFNLIDSIFTLNQLKLSQNDHIVWEGLGNYFVDRDTVDFKFWGDNIDLNNFVRSLTKKKDLFFGKAKTNLKLIGSLPSPQLIGNISVGKGRFSKFHFDSIYAVLDESNKINNGIEISQLSVIRTGQFQIQGSGFIPLSSEENMNISLLGQGNLLSILPEIEPFFKETASSGKWRINFIGSLDNPILESGDIQIKDGYLKLGAVAPEIKDINANIKIELDGFVNVAELNGKIKGKPFKFSNQRADSVLCKAALYPFTIPDLGFDFGVFSLETSAKGVPLHIPGLMEKGEIGNFEFTGRDTTEKFYFAGPNSNPVARGVIRLRNVNLMYPFKEIPGMGESPVVKLLKKVNWNVKAVPVKDTRYEKEIPSGVDKVFVNLLIDSGTGWLDFSGIIEDSTFYIEGNLESSAGNVDYLDFDFRIEKAGIEFDKSTLFPIAYGQAKAIIADSLGTRNYIYLTLLLEDEISHQTQPRGRWEKINFQLSTDNPNIGRTDAEILASLGYFGENIKEKARDIIGISTDNLILRPIYRQVERTLERTFNLDLVRFSSRFTRNLIDMNVGDEDYVNKNSKLYLLRSSRLIIGKYLTDNLFLSYTGQLEAGLQYYPHGEGLGLNHSLGLEYRINPNLLLEMEYNYNSFLLHREEKRIFLRHSFPIQ